MTDVPAKIRLLIVDDSTFVRRALVRVISTHEDIEIVGEAQDGITAIEAARQLKPDVMTLDLQMPNLNGIDVLRVLKEEMETRIIMVSSFTKDGAEETFLALEEGAFDFVDKTSVRNRMDFMRLGEALIEKILLAAREVPATLTKRTVPTAGHIPDTDHSEQLWEPSPDALVVVGASTGGPPAVRRFLTTFSPSINAAFIIIQHMPPGFSGGFAKRLNQVAPIAISELVSEEMLLAGHAYVVPSGQEVDLSLQKGAIVASIHDGSSDNRHRPSLDRTLTVASELDFDHKFAVVLTGMGADGQTGSIAFTDRGGTIAVQNEESCIIYGMPKTVKDQCPDAYEGTPEELGEYILGQLLQIRKS